MGNGASGGICRSHAAIAPSQAGTPATTTGWLRTCISPDVFDDLSLLLPEGKTAAQALTTWCFPTYRRSDLYAEPDPLD
uniref:hypothetical protein n=1 Tax=Serratia entomophila TaxID=42906 RepID=UPI001F4C3964|nr:hypothetical protein [Serratia entomophila]